MNRKFCITIVFIAVAFSCAHSQWKSLGGPIDGIKQFAIVDSTLIALTNESGVFISTDFGLTWVPSHSGVPSYYFEWIFAFDSTVYGIWYNGFARSTDNGRTWSQITTGPSGSYTECISSTKSNMFVATYRKGIFRSGDQGLSWTSVNSGLFDSTFRTLFYDGNALYAYTSSPGKLYQSTNEGVSWNKIDSGFLSKINLNSFLHIDTTEFALVSNKGIFRSLDFGANWVQVNSGLMDSNFNSVIKIGNNLFAASSTDIYVSSDNGNNWIKIFTLAAGAAITSLVHIGTHLFAGTTLGVFHSIDMGKSWVVENSGIPGGSIDALLLKNNNLFLGKPGGVFKYGGGKEWSCSSSGIPNGYVRAFATKDSEVIAATSGKGIFRSFDGCKTWTSILSSPITDEYVESLIINDTDIFAGTESDGIVHSTNNGASWNHLDSGLLSKYAITIEAITISNNTIVAGTFDSGIYISTNGGAYWSHSDNGLTDSNITSFVKHNGELFVSTWGGVFISDDDGFRWYNRTNPPLSKYIYALASKDSNIYAAGNGFFLSTNDGVSWTDYTDDLPPNVWIRTLMISDSAVYAGTYYGQGVWYRSLSDFKPKIIIEQVNLDSNSSIALSPNPTTGIITIHNAPANMVHITITNVLGEIVSEAANSGAADFTIDLSKLLPGTYFARFLSAGEVITRKIVKE